MFRFLLPCLASLSLLPSTARAQQASLLHLSQPATASLRLRFDNPAHEFTQVRVVRVSTGQPLFVETTQEAAYGHRFDFDRVPSGSYTLEVCLGPACTLYTVQIRTRARHSTITACVQTARQVGLELVTSAH